MKRYTGELLVALILGFLIASTWILIREDLQPKPEPKPVKLEKILTPKQHVMLAAKAQGWGTVEHLCLKTLITRENRGWNPKAKNPTSSASGLFQMLRGKSGTMYRDLHVKDQARLGVKYILHRYDSPCRALDHHLKYGWY